jgi:hypothetical protein
MRTKVAVTIANVCAVLALLLVVAAPRMAAHHAFGAEFDAAKPLKLRGTVSKIEWVNPHAWIHIDVKRQDGTVESWAIEGGPPNSLVRRGINRKDLPIGTEILVDGYQAIDGSRRANGRTLQYADGRTLFMGSSGTGAPLDGRDPTAKK